MKPCIIFFFQSLAKVSEHWINTKQTSGFTPTKTSITEDRSIPIIGWLNSFNLPNLWVEVQYVILFLCLFVEWSERSSNMFQLFRARDHEIPSFLFRFFDDPGRGNLLWCLMCKANKSYRKLGTKAEAQLLGGALGGSF